MKKIELLLLSGVIAMINWSCIHQSASNPNSSDPARRSPETATSSIKDKTAIEKMEIAFGGGYKKEDIKARLDQVIELYGLTITEENYSRAGSTLVALRKKNGTREMDILDYMIRSHDPGVKMHFADAASIASAVLVLGDK